MTTHITETDLDVRRTWLALVLAELNGDCDTATRGLLHRADAPHFAAEVAHHAAHSMIDRCDSEDLRAELLAACTEELHALATASTVRLDPGRDGQ